MTVLDRSELQASPLSDLHLIAGQIGVEGFRRLRKDDLIDAILAHSGADGGSDANEVSPDPDESQDEERRPARSRRSRGARSTRATPVKEPQDAADGKSEPAASRTRRGRAEREGEENAVEGTVEILGNGSAFLRVRYPEPSEDDVYISAAQVRRCELVSGDRVKGPVRTPRRSERYPSLIRIETINGEAADSAGSGTRYDELPVVWPNERIAFDSQDPTLSAIEWLIPIGRGSRALIVGAARAGKTETLRRILAALAGRDELELMPVLSGLRPEEIGDWLEAPVAPLATLSFAASADAQGQAVEAVLETAKRLAARGGHPVVLIDNLDGLHPHAARRVLAAARNLRDSGSLTVIAVASRPFGGETTVIALDAAHASVGRFPAIDLLASGTLRAELLVGEQGAEAIARERASVVEG